MRPRSAEIDAQGSVTIDDVNGDGKADVVIPNRIDIGVLINAR